MAKSISMSEYSIFILQIFEDSDSNIEHYNRLIDDLDYYMLDTPNTPEKLYYFIKNDVFYVIAKKSVTQWNNETLNILFSNDMKSGSYICVPISGYFGKMPNLFWDKISRVEEYYASNSKVRKELKEELKLVNRKRKLEKLIDNMNKKDENTSH